jgi:hypothetical protein
MHTLGLIEEIIVMEMKGLCTTCAHATHCVYLKSSSKAIIQCELFELDGTLKSPTSANGLCKTCDNASRCNLPGRAEGVWHCNEFI